MIELRPYQKECKDTIDNTPYGAHIAVLATALGKTIIYTHLKRRGRVLVLAHREELINQPLKYYDCPVGVEMADRSSNGEEVVIASVQSLIRRLDRFRPSEFDMIITDECHHASARSYRTIYDHFHPRLHIGFTATPNRGDKVRLDDIYQDIIFKRDLRWGIQNNYLSDIYCRRVSIGYDLSRVRSRMGDYAPGELEEAMDGTADAIGQAYRDLAVGATLIFAVSVKHAQDIAGKIPGAVVVTGETPDRSKIVADFTEGRIPCIVSVAVFLEGTDMPRIETIIMARPTQSDTLYTQAVGRGLRLFPGKKQLNLIDCVGVTGTASLCTAPTLIGIDVSDIPQRKQSEVQGPLFELPELAIRAADGPESWIKSIKYVDLWAKEQKYETHGVVWQRMPDGSLVCSLPERKRVTLRRPDELGRTCINGELLNMQEAFDRAYLMLKTEYADCEAIWNKNIASKWGKAPASEKQIAIIKQKCKGFKTDDLTKIDASQILNRLFNSRKGRAI